MQQGFGQYGKTGALFIYVKSALLKEILSLNSENKEELSRLNGQKQQRTIFYVTWWNTTKIQNFDYFEKFLPLLQCLMSLTTSEKKAFAVVSPERVFVLTLKPVKLIHLILWFYVKCIKDSSYWTKAMETQEAIEFLQLP